MAAPNIISSPRHLVVARCERTKQVTDVVSHLVEQGAPAKDLTVVAREPVVVERRPPWPWGAVAAGVAAGTVLGLLGPGVLVGLAVGLASALASATVVRRRRPTPLVGGRRFEVVASGPTIALADRVLSSRTAAAGR